MSKFEDGYRAGFERCYEIWDGLGKEFVEKERIARQTKGYIPPGITSYILRKAARKEAEQELMIVALALAETLTVDMKIPAFKCREYLRAFNDRCDLYRYDPEAMEKAERHLESMPVITEMAKKYLEE